MTHTGVVSMDNFLQKFFVGIFHRQQQDATNRALGLEANNPYCDPSLDAQLSLPFAATIASIWLWSIVQLELSSTVPLLVNLNCRMVQVPSVIRSYRLSRLHSSYQVQVRLLQCNLCWLFTAFVHSPCRQTDSEVHCL